MNRWLITAIALTTVTRILEAEAAPPLPARQTELMSVKVNVADLDLTTALGRQRLEDRLRASARRICWITSSDRVIDRHQTQADCVSDAISAAWLQVARHGYAVHP